MLPDDQSVTKTRDVSVQWVRVPSRMLYLVVDEGNTYKPYLDRYFIFADPEDAIEKVKILCQADPLIGSLHGEKITPSALTPEMLKPGTRFVFQKDYVEVYIIAVPLSAYNVGSFNVGGQR